MHNGSIEGFSRIKRRLREALPDPLYDSVQGTTDSEHAFALFLSFLGDSTRPVSGEEMGRTLVRTVARLEEWRIGAAIAGPSFYNFAVTDGSSISTPRYMSDPNVEPISLYFASDRKYECVDGVSRLVAAAAGEHAVVNFCKARLE